MNSILNSFQLKSELNPEIWVNNKLNPEIRKQLLDIAKLFVEYIDIPDMEVEDVTITGSIANYNWSEYSDIDLHILVDYTKIADDPEFAAKFLAAKKALFNDKYNFSSKGFDVELYAQDINEEHTSTGVYSVLFNNWITEPKPLQGNIDINLVKEKAQQFINIIEKIENLNEDANEIMRLIKLLKEKISKYRKAGLASGGELSVENLAFKYLRRGGWLDKLSELSIKAMDDKLTVEDFNE